MATDRDRRALELLGDVLDLPRAERESFLKEQCGEDSVLLAEVESLLSTHERAGGFLESPPEVESVPGDPVDQNETPRRRRRGRYRVLGEVARGGMGTILEVWDEELKRPLAMKVLGRKGHSPLNGMIRDENRRVPFG